MSIRSKHRSVTEEYVALYQKQRSALQQRARETDLKMERVSKEKERLLNIVRSILTTNNFDCSFVKQLGNVYIEMHYLLSKSSSYVYSQRRCFCFPVERNLSSELSDELAQNFGSSLSNGESYSFYQSSVQNDSGGHHPSCPCCSGQLITV